ncbi:MAG: hypothetical protein JWO95_1951 [Verrucomicrobiales bacterium]|nr:hypothetical protein [Verrucomicrobiales bacterium]
MGQGGVLQIQSFRIHESELLTYAIVMDLPVLADL